MRSKYFGLFMLVALVIFGGLEAKAGNSTEPDSKVTFKQLGELDNKIKILEKRLKIKELESKIQEVEGESSKNDMLKALKQKMSSPQAQNPAFSTGSVKMQESDNKKPRKSEDRDFKNYISTFRVMSINGFDDNLMAKIESPKHGSFLIRKGHHYDNLGQVNDITMHNVVLEKNDKNYIISHKRGMTSRSSSSGSTFDSTNIR